MEQLTNLLQERLGLSEEMAQQASDVVLEFLQSKLPEPIASQLASYIGDAADEGDDGIAGSLLSAASSFLGGDD